jgi:hypothetical protein
MKSILQMWIKAAYALLEIIIIKLKSPVKASKYISAYFYEGPFDDATGTAIEKLR